jgi:tRNA (mo5U34)-methyltransferase
MDREQIIAGLERLGPWFHRIDLGRGITTKTASSAGEPADHPLGTWEIVKRGLPEDLTGKSVLDVGCNAGFYSFEAKKRNALKVLGVDSSRLHVSQARFVSRVLGLEADFQRASLYDLSPANIGQFDVTLALGLIYHCKHLIHGLERLFLMTRELLILESAILPPELTPEPIDIPLGDGHKELLPLAWVVNDPDAMEAAQNWFLPSPRCLQAMLRTVGFDSVEIISIENNRVVLTAGKRGPYLSSTVPVGLRAAITLEQGPGPTTAGSTVEFTVGLENSGRNTWLASKQDGSSRGVVFVGLHLLDLGGEVLEWEFARIQLPRDMEPGDRETLTITVTAPDAPGRCLLELDLVSEQVAWFEDLGSPTVTVPLDVDRPPAR